MSDGTINGGTGDLGGVAGAIKRDGNRSFIYTYVTASAAVGTPFVLDFDGDEETNPKVLVPATSSVYQYIVFPTVLSTTAGFQWCQFRGDAYVLVDGTTDVAKDDFLEVLNTGTALVKDGTSRTTNSVAIAQEARTANSAGLTYVYLLGDRVIVAAS